MLLQVNVLQNKYALAPLPTTNTTTNATGANINYSDSVGLDDEEISAYMLPAFAI